MTEPQVSRIDELIAKGAWGNYRTILTAIREGYVPTGEQIDDLIAQDNYEAHHLVETAFEGGRVIDCDRIALNHLMSGTYKTFPGSHGEVNLLIRIDGNLYLGDDPVTKVKDALDEIVGQWYNGYPNVLTRNGEPIMFATWKTKILEGLEKIEAGRPGLSFSH